MLIIRNRVLGVSAVDKGGEYPSQARKRLVASKRVDLRALISRVFPLRGANAALTLACAKNEAVKVQIDLT